MNGTKDSIDKIVEFLNNGDLDPNCGETGQIDNGRISSVFVAISFTEVVVGVPAIYLDYCRKNLKATVGVAAQNCYKAEKGAFTGAIKNRDFEDYNKVNIKARTRLP